MKFDSKVGTALHQTAKVALFLPRQAFRLLVKWNVWALAKIIYNTYTYSDKALLSKWQNAWYNLGGDWKELAKAITEGYNKKPFGYKLAPAKLKTVIKKYSKISGYSTASLGPQGIGAVTLVGVLTTAGTIIAALLPLLELIFNIAGKSGDIPQEDESYIYDFGDEIEASISSEYSKELYDFQKQYGNDLADVQVIPHEVVTQILEAGGSLYDINPKDYTPPKTGGSGGELGGALPLMLGGALLLSFAGEPEVPTKRKRKK